VSPIISEHGLGLKQRVSSSAWLRILPSATLFQWHPTRAHCSGKIRSAVRSQKTIASMTGDKASFHNVALVDTEPGAGMTTPANECERSRISRITRRLREVKLPYALYLAFKRLSEPGWFEYDHQYVLSLDVSRLPPQATENDDIREITAEDREDLDKTDDPPEVVLGPVEIQDSLLGLFVIQARDGTLCADRRPMGED